MRLLITALLLISLLPACDVTIKKDDGTGQQKGKIRNGIKLKTEGIDITQAFLLFEDGTLVPENNKFKVNQKVRLRLIGTGWSEKEGRVFLDAIEKVETNEGDVILNAKDLFGEYADGVAAKDAEYLTLDVVITRVTKLFDYYKVSFQVKDKNDPSKSVEGEYKLYLE